MSISFEKVDQPTLAGHNSSVLDLAFAIDCTASMSPYIFQAKESVGKISMEIASSQNCNVRFALIEYRDHPPEDKSFVTKVHDFEQSITKVEKWLDDATASGGGDIPEAVADALHESLGLSWREDSTKILILIADAAPHGLQQSGDNFPKGCPLGHDPVDKVDQLVSKDVTMYVVGCEPNVKDSKEFYSAMAFKTGGQYVPLGNAQLLTKVIIGGAQEEIELKDLLAEITTEVEAGYKQSGDLFDVDKFTKERFDVYKSKGIKTKQLWAKNDAGSAPIGKASPAAVNLSKMSNLSDISNAIPQLETGGMKFKSKKKLSGFGSIFGSRMTASEELPTEEELDCSTLSLADDYVIEDEEITNQQVERMANKAFNKVKKK